jgi:arylsulfatase
MIKRPGILGKSRCKQQRSNSGGSPGRLSRSLVAQVVAGTLLFGAARTHAGQNDAPATPPAALSQATDLNLFHHGYPQEPQAPAHAPNVLVILTDDVGFAASSTFGGAIPTPALDFVARQGLRYNDFNTTAMCSPTRAALLTGRNHHNVAIANVTSINSGFDGYTSVMPKSAATLAEVLKENGYNTGMFGKSHLTPEWEMSAAGPFDRWPTGLGFEYFYGFLAADTDQWAPTLVENTTPVQPPRHDPGYILDRDLADHAINWLHQQHSLAPSKPFFLYYASGSTHSPNQAPADWIARFKGKFAQGWDKVREESFARQKALGVIPKDARLTPRPPELPAWNSLSAGQRRLAERLMEAYAAQLAFADAQIGRVLDALKQSGQLDNTLVIFIEGDNGASGEGGAQGLLYELSPFNQAPESLDYALSRIDDIGGPKTYNLYPAAWGWAMNTPFQWFKQDASHFGGTRNGMAVSWPGHIKGVGGLRSQFCHVTDITPTILDVVGIKPPQIVNGVEQKPIDGMSFAYTFEHADAASERHTQYFEMMQNISIYHDGWVAATRPLQMPWEMLQQSADTLDLNGRQWELYHVAADFSEADDLVGQHPEKLHELQDLFLVEASRNRVLPIHSPRVGAEGRPSLGERRTSFTYFPDTAGVYPDAAPHVAGKSFEIAAEVDVPAGADGVLLAQGGQFAGYSFYLKNGRLAFCYNAIPPRLYTVRSDQTVSPGHHVLVTDFESDDPHPGSGGWVTLKIDGQPVARGHVEHTLPRMGWTEGLDVGRDLITAVSDDYEVPDDFTGEIRAVTVDVK